MIEPEDYRLPRKQPKEKEKPKPKDSEDAGDWLEKNMPFKPFGCEW